MDGRLQLMLLMGPMVPVPAPAVVVDALQSAQVTRPASGVGGFQLSFAVSSRSPISTALLPAGYFDPRIRVVLIAVVGGLANVLMDGVITRQELTPSDDPGGSVLTITGEDLSVVMDLVHVRQCYPALPAQARVAAICAKYAMWGIVPAVVPPLFTDVPDPVSHIPIQSSTDLAYVRALASEAGYVFQIVPGPAPGASIAYWGPQVRVGPLQRALTVAMGPATNVESLSFGYDGLSRTQYTITYTEPTTKLGIGIPVPDVSLLHPPLAARPAVALREQPLPDASDRSTAELLLLGLSRTSTSADAVTGQGKLDVLRYGSVLRSGELVGVRGAGVGYDGAYFVSSVTHELRRGSYQQNFSLTRDGLVSLTPQVVV